MTAVKEDLLGFTTRSGCSLIEKGSGRFALFAVRRKRR
jgi:hypothetical protein